MQTTTSYDTSHRRTAVIDSRGNKTLSYGYSPGGLLNYLQDNDGNRTDYLYDSIGQLSGIWAANYDYVSFSYDPAGHLVEKMFSSGADSRSTYNPDNSLASLTNKHGLTTLSSHVYSYDALGNRSTQTETVGATLTNYAYGYDALNRLTQVQNGIPTQQENYAYDPLGNRTTKSIGATTPSTTAYVYDSANQLKEIRSGSATGTLLASLTYDADGNLKNRSDTGLTLNYDALNRLTATSQTGQLAQSYSYDDQGRRISKTIGTTTTNFLYNGADILAEYPATWGLPSAQYTHGNRIDDTLIRATATSAQYFHQDGLGSIVGVTNPAGLTDATQRFDAWGNKLASTGTAPRYGYTGREPDETGLIFYRARYYDPSVGRFTQRDPIGLRGGLNRYSYVANDPCNATDPSGEDWKTIVQVIGVAIGLLGNPNINHDPNAPPIPPNASGSPPQGQAIGMREPSLPQRFPPLPAEPTPATIPQPPSEATRTITLLMDGAGNVFIEIFGGIILSLIPGNIGQNDPCKLGSLCGPVTVFDPTSIFVPGTENGSFSYHGGGATVGGLGRISMPAAPYSGNQK